MQVVFPTVEPVFDFVTDLHVDMWKDGVDSFDPAQYKNPKSNVLVVAGDISNHIEDTIRVLERCREVYEFVLAVDGNHEHYLTGYQGYHTRDTVEYLKTTLLKKGVYFLDGTYSVHLGTTAFIGANGWYDFRVWEDRGITEEQSIQAWLAMSNDSRHIKFSTSGPAADGMIDIINLTNAIEKAQKNSSIEQVVVITHTAPHWKAIKYTGDPTYDKLTGSFCNSGLEKVRNADQKGKITTWVHGHTHLRKDFVDGGIRYINNTRGYEFEQEKLGSTWFAIDIDPRIKYE